ncbi:MAG: hypothetical protein M9916_01565 [Crocinitomicaceae bacterium]|nr:hypothetical protein [Crocinitomicaceae bacterium]
MMYRVLTILFLIVHYFQVSAQRNQLVWGEVESNAGFLVEMLPLQGKDFYTLRWKGGNALGGYYLTSYSYLNKVKTKRVSIAVNYNIANFEDVIVVNGLPSVVLSNIKGGREQVFLQQYDEDLEQRGEPIIIADYDVRKVMSKAPIKIIQSKDKKYFAVLWQLAGAKNEHDIYGYFIYDNKFNLIDQGEYELPYESRYSQITSHILSNTGDYFFVVKEFEANQNRGLNQANIMYKAMHITQAKAGKLQTYTLPVQGKRIEAISVNIDDSSSYVITGVYGANELKGIQGIFYMKLDFDKQQIINQGFYEIDKDFITEDWSQREIEHAEKKELKGKYERSLYDYKMRETQILPDGGMVGIMEQSYFVVHPMSDYRGTTYSYTYYYNDIIVFKIGNKGTFDWVNKVKKTQVSTNDEGSFSSFASIVDSNSIRLVFNDNIENYDGSGNFMPEANYYTSFNIRYNTVAIAEIDTKVGTQSRTILYTGKDVKTIAVPKLFKIDNNSKEMLIYTTNKGRELYGVLSAGE